MPGLTPMIDVVFLLLVFFMLAASFDETVEVPIRLAGAAPAAGDAPRLVDVLPGGLRLNGVAVTPQALVEGLSGLVGQSDAVVVIRPRDGADVQRVLDVMGTLAGAGFGTLALVE